MAAARVLNLKWKGRREERSREMMSQSRLLQARVRHFSFRGRRAMREYCCERGVRRWFWAGSETVMVMRVRRVRDLEGLGGRGGGERSAGSFPEMDWERAMVV